MTDDRDPRPNFSDITVTTHGCSKVVFVAGQVAENSALGMASQTSEVLGLIDSLLEHAGARREHIVSAQIYLVSAGDYAEVIAVWNAWVAPGLAPARATVGPKLINNASKVVIEVTAAFTPVRLPPTSRTHAP